MDVNFSDSFFDSFKKMIRRERWYFKLWYFFKTGLPGFFRNVWIFRKALWKHRWWDWRFTLDMMHTSISEMERGMHKGIEVRESRDKKIAKMQRAIYLMEIFKEDDFVKLAEKELGPVIHHEWIFEPVEGNDEFSRLKDQDTPDEKAHNSKVYARSRVIEEELWEELWEIFKGQDTSKFKKIPAEIEQNHDKSYDYWNEQFDGSGMRGWWD